MIKVATFAMTVVATACSPADAVALDAQFDATAQLDASPAPATIPITMMTLANGNVVATVQVAIGGSPPFTALVDTGSVGLRVVTGTVADTAWQVGTQTTTATYGSGLVAKGVVATAIVTLGTRATAEPIAMEDITSVSCSAAHPMCPALGVTAADFRFANTFPAILGIGMRTNLQSRIASPIAAIGANHESVLSLPKLGGTTGTISIDPSAAVIAGFAGSTVSLTSLGAPLPDGIGAFADTQVPFCINAFCAHALLDTGQQAILIQTTDPSDFTALRVPANATSVPPTTAVTVTVAGNLSWSFVVGMPPKNGVDLIRIDGGVGAGIMNLGIAPFYIYDAYYDYAVGTIGLAPKP